MNDSDARYVGRCVLIGAALITLAILVHGMWSVEFGAQGNVFRTNLYTGKVERIR